MKHSIVAIAAVLAVAGCASQTSRDALQIQDPTVLANGFQADQSTQAGAVTDTWIAQYRGMGGFAGSAMLDDVQIRLHTLGARERGSYFGAKAQCWIDAAREERALHDRWGFVEEATHEADMLVSALETRAQPSAENPKLRTSSLLRPDLWRQLMAAKSSADWQNCPQAQQVVACGEVGLIHAGHEAWTRAFDASRRRVAAIEQQISTLPRTLSACAPPPAPLPLPPKVTLPTDTLFEFDRSDVAGMLPQGRSKLDELVRDLGANQDVTEIHADGYTDRIGSERYNMALSQRRADTVVSYLRNQGATVPMSATGHGKADPVVQCGERERRALIECLAPNRRVELKFLRQGVAQAASQDARARDGRSEPLQSSGQPPSGQPMSSAQMPAHR
jgi:outer membrane protein OmpA-like peptidoglycan-associated protein